ncbi:Melibiose operon regulatory protein [uncultured Eubacterium sp.]|nr:Melibiose operon regulatory protein [uncultured Eubacterium sp.]
MLFEKTAYLDDFPINIRIAKVSEYPIHYHQDIEFIYVLRGEIWLKNGYCDYLLKDGDIFTNSGHEVHSLTATDQDNVVAIIQVSNRFFTQYFPTLNKACYRTYVNKDLYLKLDNLRKMLLQILVDYVKKSFNYKSACTYRMVEVIRYLNENFNLFAFEDQVVVNFKNDNPVTVERISRIITYIYENYASRITLDDLADMEHLSTFYLSHLIREYTGMNFREFLSFARVEMSEIDLLETDKKISAVARDAGFSTTSYYENSFTKWFKLTPEEHRAKYLPLILSPYREAKLEQLSMNVAVNLIRHCLSAVSGRENSPQAVGQLQLNVDIDLGKEAIRQIDHSLEATITMDDFAVMDCDLFKTLEDLSVKVVNIAVSKKDEAEDLARKLSEKGFITQIVPQSGLKLSSAYGYDSIAAFFHVFKEHFLSNDEYIAFRLRDPGDEGIILKGCPSCLTSNILHKPSYYAYRFLGGLKGDLLYWSKYYCVVRSAHNGQPVYLLMVCNTSDDIDRLCSRNASVYETNDVIHDFKDEMNLDFNLKLTPGQYQVIKYSLSSKNTIFEYMAQLDFPERNNLPDNWLKLLCTQPYANVHLDDVDSEMNLNFEIRGAGIQLAIIQKRRRLNE